MRTEYQETGKDKCKHSRCEYRGLLFIDWTTGYVTQAAYCPDCKKTGQVPTMFCPECLWQFTKHPQCIEINKPENV